MRTKLFILLFPFLLSCCATPPVDVWTYIWLNPIYPTYIYIPKGAFDEKNKGTAWFDSKEDLDEFMKELYRKLYPPEESPEPQEGV